VNKICNNRISGRVRWGFEKRGDRKEGKRGLRTEANSGALTGRSGQRRKNFLLVPAVWPRGSLTKNQKRLGRHRHRMPAFGGCTCFVGTLPTGRRLHTRGGCQSTSHSKQWESLSSWGSRRKWQRRAPEKRCLEIKQKSGGGWNLTTPLWAPRFLLEGSRMLEVIWGGLSYKPLNRKKTLCKWVLRDHAAEVEARWPKNTMRIAFWVFRGFPK